MRKTVHVMYAQAFDFPSPSPPPLSLLSYVFGCAEHRMSFLTNQITFGASEEGVGKLMGGRWGGTHQKYNSPVSPLLAVMIQVSSFSSSYDTTVICHLPSHGWVDFWTPRSHLVGISHKLIVLTGLVVLLNGSRGAGSDLWHSGTERTSIVNVTVWLRRNWNFACHQ